MDYYLSNNDGQYTGPYSKDRLIAAGLDRSTMVWRQGLAAWTPAEQLRELDDIINDVPPPMEMTLGPTIEVRPVEPVQQVAQQPAAQVAQQDEDMKRQLEQLNQRKAELKKVLEQKKAEKQNKLVAAQKQQKLQVEEKKKKEEVEKKKETKDKKKSKSKYDYPVCDWRNESIWILAFVVIHAILALCGQTTFFYIYLDIVGAVLSIIGIVIGIKIRKLNAISYKKGSESRLKAEPLGYYNGILVSATAAIGFLIILVQSAHYVYVA